MSNNKETREDKALTDPVPVEYPEELSAENLGPLFPAEPMIFKSHAEAHAHMEAYHKSLTIYQRTLIANAILEALYPERYHQPIEKVAMIGFRDGRPPIYIVEDE